MMKKLINKINPKNYTMPVQIFLILFSVFFIFVLLEIWLFNNVKTEISSKKNYKEYISLSESFFLKENLNYKDYIEYNNSNNWYIIKTDNDMNITDDKPYVKYSIDDSIYYSFLDKEVYDIDATIYFTNSDNIITRISDVEFTGSTKGTIKNVVLPESINYYYINNNNIKETISTIKKSYNLDKTKSGFEITLEKDLSYFITYHKYDTGYIFIIIPTIEQSSILKTFSLFQSLIFLLMLSCFIGLALLFNNLYIKPIKEMTIVTSHIKELNFAYYVEQYSNKEYRELGRQINELSSSLHEVIDNLNYKNEEVTKYISSQEKDYEQKKRLVATISHEIKTPLAIMQATISGIIDGIFEGEDVNKELKNLLQEIEKTNNMLQEIVQLYKMETSDYKLLYEKIDLTLLIKELIKELNKLCLKYNQHITFNGIDNLIIYADKKQITRALNNVILNAVIYSPKGQNIDINVYERTNYYAMEVINYGVYIDNNDLDKIFEPFYRVDKSRKKSEDHGNGLGLYVVKQILDKHGYDYGMENINNGVRFYILFSKYKDNEEKI